MTSRPRTAVPQPAPAPQPGAPQATPALHDWNRAAGPIATRAPVELCDETFRDGLQSPSVIDPSVEDKLALLHLMAELRVHTVNVGLPGASPRATAHVLALCGEILRARLPLHASCAARTVTTDIVPAIEVSQRLGIPIEIYTFIGSSAIRQFVEGWQLARLVDLTRDAVALGVRHGLSVAYVTEDTTRAQPATLATLFKCAVDSGARRLCLCDTVGHATPRGVRNLVEYTRGVLAAHGATAVALDWHGHNDRGLGLGNALAAVECGVERIHGTALGIGERTGNVVLEELLVNLAREGQFAAPDPRALAAYRAHAARTLGWTAPDATPGADPAR